MYKKGNLHGIMKKAGILLEPLYCPEFETFSVLNCKLLLGFFKVSELY